MPSSRRPLLLLLVALLGPAAAAIAAPPGRALSPAPIEQAPLQRAPNEQTLIQRGHRDRARNEDALSDSVRRIERSTRGQVLSAERVPYDGRSVNRIKIVDDRGRVRVYMDDPASRPQPQPPEPPTRGDDD